MIWRFIRFDGNGLNARPSAHRKMTGQY